MDQLKSKPEEFRIPNEAFRNALGDDRIKELGYIEIINGLKAKLDSQSNQIAELQNQIAELKG